MTMDWKRHNRWEQLTPEEKQSVLTRMAACADAVHDHCRAYADGKRVKKWRGGVDWLETPPTWWGDGYNILLSRFEDLMGQAPQNGKDMVRGKDEAVALAEMAECISGALAAEETHLDGVVPELMRQLAPRMADGGAKLDELLDRKRQRAEQNRQNASRPRPCNSQDPAIDWNRVCKTIANRLKENAKLPLAKRKTQDAVIADYIKEHNLNADAEHQITIKLEAIKSRVRRWQSKHGKKK